MIDHVELGMDSNQCNNNSDCDMQAFLIAFTSEFLPKQLYGYEYNWDLHGYVNYSLAWAPTNATAEQCRSETRLSLCFHIIKLIRECSLRSSILF